jgi:membrane protein
MNFFAKSFDLAHRSVQAWIDDRASSRGASLAYYTLFSLAPLLLIVIAVAGLVFGPDAARGEVFEQLEKLMGTTGAKGVQEVLANVNHPAGGFLATGIGLVLMLIGATTVLAELQNALDVVWRAPPADPSRGLWNVLRARFLSFSLILGIGVLLIISLLINTALSALQTWGSHLLGGWSSWVSVVNFLSSFLLMTGMFAMIYKLMPRTDIRWSDVWIGSMVTAMLFTLGRWLIGLYISSSTVANGFGAAGSVVVMLVWIYYAAQIFLLGAEFTWVYTHTYGSRRDEEIPSLQSVL